MKYPPYTDKKLEKLFRSYLEDSGKESDFARNEISLLERLTGEEVVNALENIEAKNIKAKSIRLYEKERDEKHEMIWDIEKVLKSEYSKDKKLEKIEYIKDKYEGLDVGDPPR